MATCPKGHDSATVDYCDICGTPMTGATHPTGGGPVPDQANAPTPETVGGPGGGASGGAAAGGVEPTKSCPVCGTGQTGRFCEEDGYDFLLAPPVERAQRGPTGEEMPSPDDAGPSGPAGGWYVAVAADRAYFDVIMGHGGADSDSLSFPRFIAERRFPLDGEQVLIGRRSRSRGVHPDIDLVGPPEDPGVSHLHALLVAQPQGWAVVDLESANGTYLNDPAANPIESNTPIPVNDGDRIYIGAWTLLTIRGR